MRGHKKRRKEKKISLNRKEKSLRRVCHFGYGTCNTTTDERAK
jgi:hypothetical protein